jgi:hypothetical protein
MSPGALIVRRRTGQHDYPVPDRHFSVRKPSIGRRHASCLRESEDSRQPFEGGSAILIGQERNHVWHLVLPCHATKAPESSAAAFRRASVTNESGPRGRESVPLARAEARDANRMSVPGANERSQRVSECRGRESNPHDPCGSQDFKSCASASFATPATELSGSLQSSVDR